MAKAKALASVLARKGTSMTRELGTVQIQILAGEPVIDERTEKAVKDKHAGQLVAGERLVIRYENDDLDLD